MAGAGQNINDIRAGQLRGIDISIHTIIPTFTVQRQRLDKELLAELKDKHGDLVIDPVPRSQLVTEALANYQTVFEFDPHRRNPATIAYLKLVDRVYYG
jgi:cellulose biosynthesis protein BcsQ